MISTKNAEKYLNGVRKSLGGDDWVKKAEQSKITYETIGGIVRRYALDCYMNSIEIKDCVKVIKEKYPEGK